MRIGEGYDVHRLVEGRRLILGGVEIPFEKGLLGHSDADVLVHAIIDSLLGACAFGDIGTHFPDTDMQYKGISGEALMKRVLELIKDYEILNIDTTVIAQAPKLSPYIAQIRNSLANMMSLDVGQISVKAKTAEKLGYLGRGEAIEVRCVCLLKKR
ncbi:MAG: 2-C-methyl-D-erythritol 2,4-cyclodiphosphate synthase [Clostridiales bacterium]|nr:2-C-methyl-D-erythritol 2,4-cyclodiphosphate synthase [Clostridiales bacterium]